MYCLHCKYTTKLRNDKEINALFASATHEGAAVSAAPTKQTCTNITILPQIAKNFWRKIFSHRLHGCTQIRRVWHPCHTHAATKLSSHRIRGTHRNDRWGISSHRLHRSFWRKIFSHRLHRFSQIRRVWHPAIPTQPLNYLPTEFTHTETMAEKKNLCTSVQSVGGSSPPEASVYSVKSVGEPYAA